jgi:hypothetical protein
MTHLSFLLCSTTTYSKGEQLQLLVYVGRYGDGSMKTTTKNVSPLSRMYDILVDDWAKEGWKPACCVGVYQCGLLL